MTTRMMRMTTMRRTTRRTSLKTAAANQIQKAHQTPSQTEMGQQCPAMNWAALSWAKSPGSSATVPTLHSSHHKRGPLHHLISFSYSSTWCCCVGNFSHGGDLLQNLFNHLPPWMSSRSTGHRHAKKSIPLVWWCHEHFCHWSQLTGLVVKVRVLMFGVNCYPLVLFYYSAKSCRHELGMSREQASWS